LECPTSTSEFIVIDLQEKLKDVNHTASTDIIRYSTSHSLELTSKNSQTVKMLAAEKAPAAQKSKVIVFTHTKHGTIEMSVLQHVQDSDSLVLHVLSDDGTMRVQTLSRLQEHLRSIDVALLGQDDDDEWATLRLLLNQKQRARYSFGGNQDTGLPAVLERTRKSIPTFIGDVRGHIEHPQTIVN